MRLAQIPGQSGPANVAVIHSSESIEALEAFFEARGIEARAVEAPGWVQIGSTYDGEAFVEPEPLPEPAPAQSITAQEVVQWAEAKLQGALADIPLTERTSWTVQVEEARAVLAGAETPTPFIDSQVAIIQPSETRQELAQKILQKAGQLAAFTGLVVGIRRSFIHQIEAGLSEPIFVASLDLALQQATGG